MELKDRIQRIIEYYGLNPSSFSVRIHAKTKQAIYDLLNEKTKTLSVSMQDKILSCFPEINKAWLLAGEGEMFNTTNVDIMKNTNEVDGLISDNLTYLLPLSAMGGSLTGFQADGVNLHQCEKIISPIKNVDFAITVCGDSMAPEYPSGSMVLLKKIDPCIFIDWGKVYVLDTSNGIIVKELHRCDEEGWVTCHSLNPDPKYADFNVRLSDIYGIYRVLMCLASK